MLSATFELVLLVAKVHESKGAPDALAHLAWPMCEASYTVGPQLYQSTWRPFFGTKMS